MKNFIVMTLCAVMLAACGNDNQITINKSDMRCVNVSDKPYRQYMLTHAHGPASTILVFKQKCQFITDYEINEEDLERQRQLDKDLK